MNESTMRALFDEVEPPARLETRWQAKVALAPKPPPADLPEARRIDPDRKPAPRKTPWLRALGAAVAALLLGGGIVGVVAANRKPTPEPDPTIIETITNGPTVSQPTGPPSGTSQPGTVPPGPPENPPGGVISGGPPAGPPTTGPGGPGGAPPPAPPAPARGPLTDWPDPANAGVPVGTTFTTHEGDLHITQAGALIADRKVNGTIYIEAPDVTLRRVRAVPRSGSEAGIRQLAPRLRIEDSEVSGGAQYGVRQLAAGLHVQRSDISGSTAAVAVSSDTTIVDSYLPTVDTRGNSARLILRHNTIVQVTLLDDGGPVTNVTIENNQLGFGQSAVVIFAPSRAGSRDIRVIGNQFRRSPADRPVPCSGWNAQAPGNSWAGNVWFGTSEPVNP